MTKPYIPPKERARKALATAWETLDDDLILWTENESSWCASNLLPALQALDEHGCLCPNIMGKYIREATEDDEQILGSSNTPTPPDTPSSDQRPRAQPGKAKPVGE